MSDLSLCSSLFEPIWLSGKDSLLYLLSCASKDLNYFFVCLVQLYKRFMIGLALITPQWFSYQILSSESDASPISKGSSQKIVSCIAFQLAWPCLLTFPNLWLYSSLSYFFFPKLMLWAHVFIYSMAISNGISFRSRKFHLL